MKGHCILSHGFESGPDATKVTALAEAAERLGWSHERPDYTDLDARREVSELGDVPARLQRLLQLAQAAAARGPLVLAGSSLGAWISAQGSLQVPLRGLFLMAPPIWPGEKHAMQAAQVPISILHAGDAGVAEQVEEALAARFQRHPRAQRAVVEEQPGVEVVEQVHQQGRRAFLHAQELAAMVEVAVLASALAGAAGLHRDPFLRHFEDFAHRRQQFVQALARGRFRNVGGCGVLLHMQPGFIVGGGVDVDRAGVLGDVGVVGAEAGHALLLAPALELVEVLAQAVGDHPRAFR